MLGFLGDLRSEHLDRHVPDEPDALAFTSPLCAPLRNSNFRRQVWCTAVEQAGLLQGLRIHNFRHTCASLLIATGANPEAVQEHLGHSSISVTMGCDTHLSSHPMSTTSSDGSLASGLKVSRPSVRSRGMQHGGQ